MYAQLYSVSEIYDNNNLISVRAGIAKLNQLRYSTNNPSGYFLFYHTFSLDIRHIFHRFFCTNQKTLYSALTTIYMHNTLKYTGWKESMGYDGEVP